MDDKSKLATFAAGCFWGVEDAFRKIPGVLDVIVGYTGGTKDEPTYEEVCGGGTGHAEAAQVEFDPTVVSYPELLEVFWKIHNPTTKDRQGPDVGSQYRSAIFFHSDEQKKQAFESKLKADASGRFGRVIITEITPAGKFFRAEEYHQRYFEKTGASSCHV